MEEDGRWEKQNSLLNDLQIESGACEFLRNPGSAHVYRRSVIFHPSLQRPVELIGGHHVAAGQFVFFLVLSSPPHAAAVVTQCPVIPQIHAHIS